MRIGQRWPEAEMRKWEVIFGRALRRQKMKVTCDACGCDMIITSSYRYLCPECKYEIEMAHVQEANAKYWEEHKKNIDWVKIKGNEVIIMK